MTKIVIRESFELFVNPDIKLAIAAIHLLPAMANLMSGLTNNSKDSLITIFVKESIRIVELLPQSEIDEQIKIITSTYNQKPNKSA